MLFRSGLFITLLTLLIIGVKRESRKAAISATERKQRKINRTRLEANRAKANDVQTQQTADAGAADAGAANADSSDPTTN